MASPLQLDTYDIIICGGGTAGLVLANRLTEVPSLTVLVLEAGQNANEDFRISTPGLFPLIMDDPDLDWRYMGEASPALNNRKIGYPRGKCLGGSSAINLMALVYPSRACLDAWAKLGNDGWGFDGMVKYLRKFQRHCPPSKEAGEAAGLEVLNGETTAMSGPVCSSYPTAPDAIQTAWVGTWKKLGKTLNGDPLDGHSFGGYTSAASVDPVTGERSHAGVAYYAPVADRKNLHVLTGAMIDKVEFGTADEGNAVATGVLFTHGDKTYTAKAKKEVILSAGVIASPAILERSGIGSKEVCDNLGIRNVVDNRHVGENLQDHLTCGLSYEVKDGVMTADVMRDPAVIQQVMELYQSTKSGPLANGGGYSFAYTPLADFVEPHISPEEMQALLDKHLPRSCEPKDSLDVQHQVAVRNILSNPTESSSSLCLISVQFDGSNGGKPKDIFGIIQPENYISVLPQLAHPVSRGSIHIQSTDPNVHPIIKPNYLAHDLDAEILARHMMQAEAVMQTSPLKDLLKPNGARIPRDHDADTLERAINLVRAYGTSNYHPCGTCAMKPRDVGGVVDSRMRVYSTKNLRVCDASIFPMQVRGNIQSTVYAVAEKGVDVLKEDLGVM